MTKVGIQLGKDVVANHNDYKGCRSEAPPGDVVHHSDMVQEGEAQSDNRGDWYFSKCRKASKITCGSFVAEQQQEHFGSLMALGGRERVREREREEEETGGRRGRPRPATMTSRVSNRE